MGDERGKRGKFGGHAGVIRPQRDLLVDVGTVAGMYPFAARSAEPLVGAPLGTGYNGRAVCMDPKSWRDGGKLRAAQTGIVAANSSGKSLIAKRWQGFYAWQGVPVIVPVDFKGEYSEQVEACGGTTLTVNRSGGLSLLDPGHVIAQAVAAGADAETVLELKARRAALFSIVIGVLRGSPIEGWEESALAAALDEFGGSTLAEFVATVEGPFARFAATVSADLGQQESMMHRLRLSLAALSTGPIAQALGGSGHMIPVGAHVSVDTSAIPQSEKVLSAAVMVTAWTAALSTHYLAHRLGKSDITAFIFDEIWRGTRYFPDLADLIGGLLRMDRHEGIVSIMLTHKWSDLREPGGGNVLANCASYIIGGLSRHEADAIDEGGLGLNDQEMQFIRNNFEGGVVNGKPVGGTGRFLLKVGERPGEPFRTYRTPTEATLSDTSDRWAA